MPCDRMSVSRCGCEPPPCPEVVVLLLNIPGERVVCSGTWWQSNGGNPIDTTDELPGAMYFARPHPALFIIEGGMESRPLDPPDSEVPLNCKVRFFFGGEECEFTFAAEVELVDAGVNVLDERIATRIWRLVDSAGTALAEATDAYPVTELSFTIRLCWDGDALVLSVWGGFFWSTILAVQSGAAGLGAGQLGYQIVEEATGVAGFTIGHPSYRPSFAANANCPSCAVHCCGSPVPPTIAVTLSNIPDQYIYTNPGSGITYTLNVGEMNGTHVLTGTDDASCGWATYSLSFSWSASNGTSGTYPVSITAAVVAAFGEREITVLIDSNGILGTFLGDVLGSCEEVAGQPIVLTRQGADWPYTIDAEVTL